MTYHLPAGKALGVLELPPGGRDSRTTTSTTGGGRFPLTGARGTGNCSRQVDNFGAAGVLGGDKFIGPEAELVRLIRITWPDQPADPRLPLYTAPEKS